MNSPERKAQSQLHWWLYWNQTQVRPPANPREAGADGKEGDFIQMLTTWKIGDSHLKARLPLSVEAEVSIRRERGTEQRYQGRGLQIPVRAREHSPFQ